MNWRFKGRGQRPNGGCADAAEPRGRGRDKMEMGCNWFDGKPHRSRAGAWARAREAFFDPAIANEIDSAVDYAMEQTGGDRKYRTIWRFYCLQIGINTFLDQLDDVFSCYRQHELKWPAPAFHARIREMKAQLDRSRGGAK